MKDEFYLNISKSYCPNWNTWEVARELYANAKDADPQFTIESPNDDTLLIYTKTVPELGHIFVVGAGTKKPQGDTIGQFGEGLLLAILTATRKLGASLVLRLPDCRLTFEFREHLGFEVLYAVKENAEPYDGYCCTLQMEGAGKILDGKIRSSQELEVIPKPHDKAKAQIYCKGIWICEAPQDNALFSYNLPGLDLNRDRGHVSNFSLKWEIGEALMENMNEDIAAKIVRESESFEANECLSLAESRMTHNVRQMLHSALIKQYGDKVVFCTSAQMYNDCLAKGYNPAVVGDGVQKLLMKLVPFDYQVLCQVKHFKESFPAFDTKEVQYLCQELEISPPQIRWFKDDKGDQLGEFRQPNNVWLNERLASKYNKFEMIRTFIHELAHYQSSAGDSTRQFERALDLFAAKLAMKVLEPNQPQHDQSIL